MKTIALLLLSTLSCFAQFRYELTPVGTANPTNNTHAGLANSNYHAAVNVGGSTRADILVKFRHREAGSTDTNGFTLTFDKSKDNSYFTNSITWHIPAAGTNLVVWETNGIDVQSYAWFRFQSGTNTATNWLTNFFVYIGRKNGH
jgi:hypothetical protein